MNSKFIPHHTYKVFEHNGVQVLVSKTIDKKRRPVLKFKTEFSNEEAIITPEIEVPYSDFSKRDLVFEQIETNKERQEYIVEIFLNQIREIEGVTTPEESN